MYSRLFGVRFTVEFTVFPIAQNRVFSVGFSSYTQLPLYAGCASVPRCLGEAEEQGQDCTGPAGQWCIFTGDLLEGFLPPLEADPILHSAEVQAECMDG